MVPVLRYLQGRGWKWSTSSYGYQGYIYEKLIKTSAQVREEIENGSCVQVFARPRLKTVDLILFAYDGLR